MPKSDSSLSLTSKLSTTDHDSHTRSSSIGTGTTLSNASTDLESTNMSLTDITSTLLSSSSLTFTETDVEKSRNITRDLLLKKQLLHDIQRLKIELSQKDLMMDTMKAENMNRIDDLEEKMADLSHEKQILVTKYEAKIRMLQVDSEKQIKMLKKELQENIQLQQEYEDKYIYASEKLSHNKEELIDLMLEEEDYLDLKGKQDELSPQQIFSQFSQQLSVMICRKDLFQKNVVVKFQLKLYENVRPLNVQIESLQQRIDLLTSDLKDREDELETEKREHEDERQLRAELDVRCQRFQVQIEDLRAQLSHKSYRHSNFDVVQGERDSLERQILDYEKACTSYKTELENKSLQFEQLRNHMSEQNQKVALLHQDKEYLSKQLNELTPRYKVLDEKYEQVYKQLDDVKHSREELYEKYLNSREHYKREYEERMKRELEELSTRTNQELTKIKDSTTEMYERENRNLREARNAAQIEQERLQSSEKDSQSKYNELIGEFRQLQISSDSKMAQLQNEVKVKSFELDRIQMLHEESLNNVKQMGFHNDTIAKKLEALSKEYYGLKGCSERKETELAGQNQELRSKLEIYEKLEKELDDVVMQAAELTNEADSERVLFAYGYGANVPSTAKRRMQQSVQLARRVLQLERANTSLRHDVDRENKKNKQLAGELKSSTALLDEAQQPYNYLIDSIRTRDEQNKSLKDTITTYEKDIRTLKKENEDIKKTNNLMTSDLERLLNQREEMSVLKQVVLGLKSSQKDNVSSLKLNATSSTVYGPHASSRTRSSRLVDDDESFRKPNPVVFEKETSQDVDVKNQTNSEPPRWYTKLKKRNESTRTQHKLPKSAG